MIMLFRLMKYMIIAVILLAGSVNARERFTLISEKYFPDIESNRIYEIEISDEYIDLLTTRKGERFYPSRLADDLKKLYMLDQFSEVSANVIRDSNGYVVVFDLKSKKMIQQVRIKGNKIISEEEIKKVTGLKKGNPVVVQKYKMAEATLVKLYAEYGYYNARAGIDGQEDVAIHISEGRPCIINEVTLDFIDMKDTKGREKLKRKLSGIASEYHRKVMQRRVVDDLVNEITDELFSGDYYLGKITRVERKYNSDKTSIDLKININAGEKITFGFRGNKIFSRGELLDFIDEIRELGFGDNYIDAIVKKFGDEYSKKGLANTTIRVIGKYDRKKKIRHHTFHIKEGRKIEIESIDFEGNRLFDSELLREKLIDYGSRLIQRGYFEQNSLENSYEKLIDYIRSEGFLAARMVSASYKFNKKKSKVNILVRIYEGNPTIVSDINITGNNALDRKEIMDILSLEQDSPFKVYAFEEGLGELKRKYRNMGYLGVRVRNENSTRIVKYSEDNRFVDIDIEIEEDVQAVVGKIMIRGNTKTKAKVILRELVFEKNDILTESDIIESENNLRKLSLFSSVQISHFPLSENDPRKNILILVTEGVPGIFELGPGYRSDLGLRLFLGTAYNNLGGWNRILTGRISVNRRLDSEYRILEFNFLTGFTEPYFLGIPFTFSSSASVERKQYKRYNAQTTGFSVGFEKKLWKYFAFRLDYGFERISQFDSETYVVVEDDGTSVTKDFNGVFNIGSITPSVSFDSRNNQLNATKGMYASLSYELADSLLGSKDNIGFIRTIGRVSVYYSPLKNTVWFFSVRGGFERSNVVNEPIPEIKVFRLGGFDSMRGFEEDELSLEDIEVRGVASFINYRTQIRFPFIGNLKWGPFFDAGNLFLDRNVANYSRFNPVELRTSAGIGFHYDTPIGPLNFEYGFKLNKVEGEKTASRFHFSIGMF